ncbi:DNA replication protein DnaC [Desulfitispora alkaliphila]
MVNSKYSCQQCKDRGLIIKNKEYAVPCNCVKQKSIAKHFQFANMSKELLRCTFNNFSLDFYSETDYDHHSGNNSYKKLALNALQASRRFCADYLQGHKGSGLMFTGQVGSGKTFLAAAIANELLKSKVNVLFAVVPDLLDEIKSTFNNNYKSDNTKDELNLLKKLRDVDVLILDDLGVHNYTQWSNNKIYSIVNYRVNNSLPTIITTNLSLREMEELLGERTTSRIIQMCHVYRLMVSKDIRHILRKKASTNYK